MVARPNRHHAHHAMMAAHPQRLQGDVPAGEGGSSMAKDKNRSGREARKPKKPKPAVKPATPGERVPGKIVTQQQSN
jgi:hypothetical protein